MTPQGRGLPTSTPSVYQIFFLFLSPNRTSKKFPLIPNSNSPHLWKFLTGKFWGFFFFFFSPFQSHLRVTSGIPPGLASTSRGAPNPSQNLLWAPASSGGVSQLCRPPQKWGSRLPQPAQVQLPQRFLPWQNAAPFPRRKPPGGFFRRCLKIWGGFWSRNPIKTP